MAGGVRTETAERLRAAFAGRDDVVEKRMVGGVSFTVDGRLVCGATSSGLLVRVTTADRDSALARPHVVPFEIGGKQPLGFVVVEPPGFAANDELAAWIALGLAAAAQAR